MFLSRLPVVFLLAAVAKGECGLLSHRLAGPPNCLQLCVSVDTQKRTRVEMRLLNPGNTFESSGEISF